MTTKTNNTGRLVQGMDSVSLGIGDKFLGVWVSCFLSFLMFVAFVFELCVYVFLFVLVFVIFWFLDFWAYGLIGFLVAWFLD